MGQLKLIGSLLLVALFTIAIVNYAVNFNSDNNTAINLSKDSDLVNLQQDLQSNMVTLKSQATGASGATYNSTIESGDETSVTGGIFKAVTMPFQAVKSIINILRKNLFGSEQGAGGFGIVLTVLGSFLLITTIFYIWKTWAGKNPD